MATIETRTRRDGTKSYRLKWLFGGKRAGAPQSVTYTDSADARRMKGAVEALGHLVYDEDPRVVTFELVTGQRPVAFVGPTFGSVGEDYIASRTRASLKTKGIYRQTLYSEVAGLADLVRRPIEAIDEDEIRRVLNAITDRGRSAQRAYELARSVFRYAVNKKGPWSLSGNPTLLVDPPKRRGRTANFLTTDEADLLLTACQADPVSTEVGAALADLVDVILGTGLRISEALGLIVADVHVEDLAAGWVDVEWQLSRPSKADPSVVLGRVALKSNASQRRVVVDFDTARVLRRLVEGKRPDEPVFTDPLDGGWWPQHRVNTAWARARTLAQSGGLTKSPRVHDLRHTHAAWLLTDGVPLLAVSRRLGHESIGITANTYGHLMPEADCEIRNVIALRRKSMGATEVKRGVRRSAGRKSAGRAPRKVAGTRRVA
ncbi:tyrosine-type recombinase/integrase [Actinocrispum wychmicini]|uniref:Site-specific recombinase XerD n=1 Tax=Actinocrispum wychmicini TaxID=1213861 RepID=A0A4R2IT60_9PSEU|nr:site-specific integrase [Actinocrispum wychmicini]TCO47288.1 site-specific recombinase XerD [Actinocrispum wychmicini]